MNLIATGEKSYYARRVPVMILIIILSCITASFSAGTANTFFYLALSNHIGPDMATVAAAAAAFVLEVGKFMIVGLFFFELFRFRYLDAILLTLSLSIIGFSLYTSTKGAQATEAAAKAEKLESKDSAQTATTPPPASAAAVIAPKFQNTTEGSRHAYKFQEARAAEAAANAAKTAAELKKEELKDSQRQEADKNRGLFLKSNINLIWLLEVVNLLFAACVGYIQSRAPIRGESNTEAPEDNAADPDEVRILKRDFVTARHKANNGDDAAGQRMEELKNKIIALGAEIPEERTKKRRVGY